VICELGLVPLASGIYYRFLVQVKEETAVQFIIYLSSSVGLVLVEHENRIFTYTIARYLRDNLSDIFNDEVVLFSRFFDECPPAMYGRPTNHHLSVNK
jgi:hypothetical protein